MVKHGPCRHCGVTSTPLWRNGPPDKPVLCNACGSRWRTKGNLINYTPLHSRAEPDEYEDYKGSSIRNGSVNKSKEVKVVKRKKNHNNDVVGLGGDFYDYSHSYRKFTDEDTSNWSSSVSDVSNSESFGPFSSTVGSDLTGLEQSILLDTTVPPRKRACHESAIEKFTRELYTIWQEQQSYCSESPEEELLYESDTPMVSAEIGHGSVLIRHPSEIAHEEESEASSFPASFVHTKANGTAFRVPKTTKSKKLSGPLTMNSKQRYWNEAENVHDTQQLLGSRDSPLCALDLNDIINHEEFAAQFTTQEQRQFLKYLPKSDNENYPISLKRLFDDPRFLESSLSFQQLLAEGVFDLSFPNVAPDDCRNLRRLALSNLLKSNWVEQYNLLKKSKNSSVALTEPATNVMELAKLAQKSQKSETEISPKDPSTMKMKFSDETKEFVDTERTGSHTKGLSISPSWHSLGSTDSHSDQDLLLDVPSNCAFPQAELLYPNQCR
ncbi:unnamed protein product [Rhodiola kirilowii]